MTSTLHWSVAIAESYHSKDPGKSNYGNTLKANSWIDQTIIRVYFLLYHLLTHTLSFFILDRFTFPLHLLLGANTTIHRKELCNLLEIATTAAIAIDSSE